MLGKEELISILFYLAGGRIRGSTRLHKVVFLVERILEINVFRFEPWKFGPWSHELGVKADEILPQHLKNVRASNREFYFH